jgi:hypothetical protein
MDLTKMPTNEELAQQIAKVSTLSFDDAMTALEAGGRLRELALSILQDQAQFEEDRRQLAAAKERLRELTPA